MAEEQARYAELVQITKPRLTAQAYALLRDAHEAMEATASCQLDRREAAALGLLLDMYDKLRTFHDAR